MSRTSTPMLGIIDTPSDATWDDLVLPAPDIQRLHEFIVWVTHRDRVQQKWGARVTSGPVALFSGASGTGKTFAARLLGNALGLDLYTIDARLLAGQYIGETEKHLSALFDALAHEPMLLLFDEADSLFSKRSEVKDAHDRYANLEVSYLLSRLERYKGPCVVTKTGEDRIDAGVLSRFQFAIDFQLPNAAARSRLWRLHLPARAPIDQDVDVDSLAKQFELTGGQIRSVALHAAFLAAGESSSIAKKHLSKAVQAELSKSGSS